MKKIFALLISLSIINSSAFAMGSSSSTSNSSSSSPTTSPSAKPAIEDIDFVEESLRQEDELNGKGSFKDKLRRMGEVKEKNSLSEIANSVEPEEKEIKSFAETKEIKFSSSQSTIPSLKTLASIEFIKEYLAPHIKDIDLSKPISEDKLLSFIQKFIENPDLDQDCDPVIKQALIDMFANDLITVFANQPPITLQGYKGAASYLAVLSDNILACGSFNCIKIWDLKTLKCTATLQGSYENCLAALFDNKLAIATANNTIEILDLQTLKCIATLQGHTDRIYCLVALPDNKLASGSNDKTIKIWDLKTFKCIETLLEHTDSVLYFAIISNDKLASSSSDRTIKFWDLNTYKCIETLEEKFGNNHDLIYLPDNKLITTSRNEIFIRDLKTKLITLLINNNNEGGLYYCPTYLSNCKLAYICNAYNTDGNNVRIWDLNINKYVATLLGHSEPISHLARLSGDRLASTSFDGTIKIWQLLPAPEDYSLWQLILITKLQHLKEQGKKIKLAQDWKTIFRNLPIFIQNFYREIQNLYHKENLYHKDTKIKHEVQASSILTSVLGKHKRKE